MVSLMLLGRAAVSFQIRGQSRLGLRISSFPKVVTSRIQWLYVFLCTIGLPCTRIEEANRVPEVRFEEERTSNNEVESFLDYWGLSGLYT
ncbi:hypothetical protein OUZ56_023628 [Daphnia magna]|uniref:Uncharacterized protein n=1 Tax=Daphnia magna TaxID=35525 RepID=A0ABR0AZG5_9CRUS|nr:hypothetical protein OUZ56_023628 [Daphnia magna]